MEKRILIASWLFLIGSGLFMMDAVSEIAHQFSPMSVLHLSEGVLFLVGSIFFMPVPAESQSVTPHHCQPATNRRTLNPVATDRIKH
jgi:hypothetical protein